MVLRSSGLHSLNQFFEANNTKQPILGYIMLILSQEEKRKKRKKTVIFNPDYTTKQSVELYIYTWTQHLDILFNRSRMRAGHRHFFKAAGMILILSQHLKSVVLILGIKFLSRKLSTKKS